MITNPVAAVTAARTAAARRAARRRYDALTFHSADVLDTLYTLADPALRAARLEALAELEDGKAWAYVEVKPVQDDMTDRWLVHSATAGLLRLAATAERSLAEASWTLAADLQPGTRMWFYRQYTEVIATDRVSADEVQVTIRYDDGETADLPWDAEDLVRTGGPVLPPVADEAVQRGVGDEELWLWVDLATTRHHGTRAGLLADLGQLAAVRVGGHAAEILYELADIEEALHCRQLGIPHPREVGFSTRWLIALFFALVAAVAMMPGLSALAQFLGVLVVFVVTALAGALVVRHEHRTLAPYDRYCADRLERRARKLTDDTGSDADADGAGQAGASS